MTSSNLEELCAVSQGQCIEARMVTQWPVFVVICPCLLRPVRHFDIVSYISKSIRPIHFKLGSYFSSQGESTAATMVTQWPVFVELSALVYLDNCKAFWHSFVYFKKYSSYPLQTWNSYSVSQWECIEARMVTQWPVFVELSALVYLDNCKAFWHSFVQFKKYLSYPLQT